MTKSKSFAKHDKPVRREVPVKCVRCKAPREWKDTTPFRRNAAGDVVSWICIPCILDLGARIATRAGGREIADDSPGAEQ